MLYAYCMQDAPYNHPVESSATEHSHISLPSLFPLSLKIFSAILGSSCLDREIQNLHTQLTHHHHHHRQHRHTHTSRKQSPQHRPSTPPQKNPRTTSAKKMSTAPPNFAQTRPLYPTPLPPRLHLPHQTHNHNHDRTQQRPNFAQTRPPYPHPARNPLPTASNTPPAPTPPNFAQTIPIFIPPTPPPSPTHPPTLQTPPPITPLTTLSTPSLTFSPTTTSTTSGYLLTPGRRRRCSAPADASMLRRMVGGMGMRAWTGGLRVEGRVRGWLGGVGGLIGSE